MKISKRLRVISDFITDNSFFLDIGCDHALLDIYTVLNKNNVRCIACDINEGPIKSARENVLKYDVSSSVSVVLADGFDAYKDGVSTVVMSGLGSTTIVNILFNGKTYLNFVDRLIVSSNNDYYFLRKEICELGFYIYDETIVYDRGKYYPIVVFEKGYKKYNKFEYKYGPVLLEKRDDCFINYLKFNRDKLIDINKSLSYRHFYRKYCIKNEIKFIDKMI